MSRPIGQQHPLFIGSASEVTFVRSPIGPKPSSGPAQTGLEIVRFADSAEENGLTRSRVPFSPVTAAAASTPDFEFSDVSLLLRGPLKVSFGYAGPDREWADSWTDALTLPSAVRITLRNANSDEILARVDGDPRARQCAGAAAPPAQPTRSASKIRAKTQQKQNPAADQPAPPRAKERVVTLAAMKSLGRSRVRGARGERGFIIVAVLSILLALAVLASAYALYTSNTAAAARASSDRLQADALITAGLELTTLRLLGRTTDDPRSSGDFQFQHGRGRHCRALSVGRRPDRPQ